MDSTTINSLLAKGVSFDDIKKQLCDFFINNHPKKGDMITVVEPAIDAIFTMLVTSTTISGFVAKCEKDGIEISCSMLYDMNNYGIFKHAIKKD